MNPRLALVGVLGIAVVLGFVAFMSSRRRTNYKELCARQRKELHSFDTLVSKIWQIAHDARSIDPSAELILLELDAHTRRMKRYDDSQS
jgi:hypothetical protein